MFYNCFKKFHHDNRDGLLDHKVKQPTMNSLNLFLSVIGKKKKEKESVNVLKENEGLIWS